MENQPEPIKRVFSLANSSDKDLHKHRVNLAMKKFQKHLLDYGSGAASVAALSERIIFLVAEYIRTLKRNDKMFRHIQTLLHRRHRQLEHLRKNDFNSFAYIITEYKIPHSTEDIYNHDVYRLPRNNSGRAKFSN